MFIESLKVVCMLFDPELHNVTWRSLSPETREVCADVPGRPVPGAAVMLTMLCRPFRWLVSSGG